MPWWKYEKLNAPLEYGSFENLLAMLAEERRKSLRRRRVMALVMLGYFVLIASIFAIVVIKHLSMASISGCFGAFGGMAAGLYALSQKQRQGIEALSQFDDVRMVPRLVELLDYPNQEYFDSVRFMLLRVLPRLQASDVGLLTAEHHAIINKVLARHLMLRQEDLPLRVAILKALEQVGDASSVSVVQALAAGSGASRGNPTLQQAAEECLPALRLRATHQLETETLLRAADGRQDASAVLLRAVDTTLATVVPSELLRSVEFDPSSQDGVEQDGVEQDGVEVESDKGGVVQLERMESGAAIRSVGSYGVTHEEQTTINLS